MTTTYIHFQKKKNRYTYIKSGNSIRKQALLLTENFYYIILFEEWKNKYLKLLRMLMTFIKVDAV